MESILDGYAADLARFRAAQPELAAAMDSRCECDECEGRRSVALVAWRRWLHREAERAEAERGSSLLAELGAARAENLDLRASAARLRAALEAATHERDTLIASWPWDGSRCVAHDFASGKFVAGEGGPAFGSLEAAVRHVVFGGEPARDAPASPPAASGPAAGGRGEGEGEGEQ